MSKILCQGTPTLANSSVYSKQLSFWQYTDEQRSRGGINAAAQKHDAVVAKIERDIEQFVLSAEDAAQRFSLAAFFRSIFPGRNYEALRRGYGSYVKGRVEAIFGNRCDSVNRFKQFCCLIRAAIRLKPLKDVVKQWVAIGKSLSSSPFRVSLRKFSSWRPDLRIW